MFVAGPKFKNPPASKLASDFRPFDPGIKLCDYLQTYEVTTMKYQIKDGTVTLGGETILSHIDFEIQGNQKIAVVGRNGAGKTTLLRLIAGELSLDRDDRRQGPGITASRQLTVEMLGQQALAGEERTVEELVMLNCPAKGPFDRERFEYEREYDTLFTGLGFQKEDKKRSVAAFSGGQKTKIALIQLLLKKPDLLLLDEPTNHLDMETASWLEGYLRQYPGAVVMVSHDRFFMDRTAGIVYELEQGKLTRYPGNYTNYREQKRKNYEIQMKSYLRQQEEIERQEELIKRFKNKPSKAAFARSRKKILERMLPVEKPREDMAHIFTGTITPLIPGSKWVFEAEHLKIGYDKHSLLELSLRIRKGQKIGILGVNGSGKTTFLKTVAGFLPAVAGECALGNNITIGYFDQYSAAIQSEKTVVEHFSDLFPSLTDKEVRTILGAYLFKGKDGAKRVDDLSGGEKARLVLAELLQSRPNFLILDEPTNHMDIQAKETLESAFQAYEGTILFVSHDRYFIRQVAKSVLIFENNAAFYYPFGYEHYLERKEKEASGEPLAARIKAEEQALIEGLKAVPRAERHRLREIPEEEAYDQWRLRLAAEAIENAAEQTEEIWQQILEKNGKREEWELEHWDQWLNEIADKNEDAACGEKQEKQAEEELSAFTEQYENAQSAWTDACLFWYDIWCEAHPEPVMDTGTSDTDGSVPQDTESSKTDGSEI
jgi:ATP-binding cassette subfamily F protein 3